MTLATNLILIILAINLMIFIFGNPSNCSPILGLVSGWLNGSNPVNLIISYGNALMIYAVLMGIIALASLATGSIGLSTGGGGMGAVVALKVLAISVFSALALFPNFSSFGFPSLIGSGIPVLETIYIIFGGLLTVTAIELMQ